MNLFFEKYEKICAIMASIPNLTRENAYRALEAHGWVVNAAIFDV